MACRIALDEAVATRVGPMKPLCFVLMPFGRKQDGTGRWIDFDRVYADLIAPAVRQAGIEPIRADEEQVGGSIHKPMFERLMLCDYAIADLATANPNVYYELGIRHALRPRSTLVLFCKGTTLPFDVAPLRGLPYSLDDGGRPANVAEDGPAITRRLLAAREDPGEDSPIFQLVEGLPRPTVDHEKTDLFRSRAEYSRIFKERLATARQNGIEAVRAVAADPAFANLNDAEAGIVVDLFLSLRAVEAYQEMIDLYQRMPPPLQRTRMVQEQRGFAFNRLGRREDAEQTLKQVIADFGPSSETNGLLGRVYKDRWEDARKSGDQLRARGELKRAIDAYLAGFEADWRDTYPGINAATLMEFQAKVDPRQAEILPVVLYAAKKRSQMSSADYWTFATLLEVAVLSRDDEAAWEALENALPLVRESWEPKTTGRNLRLIREHRVARGEKCETIDAIEAELGKATLRPS
jgi:tetratricopeptide (TPR) repeat protein